MSTFIAVHRGRTVADARLIAVSADPKLVGEVASRLLQESKVVADDAVIHSVDQGRKRALRLIQRESANVE